MYLVLASQSVEFDYSIPFKLPFSSIPTFIRGLISPGQKYGIWGHTVDRLDCQPGCA
jgi:hypothetical protein